MSDIENETDMVEDAVVDLHRRQEEKNVVESCDYVIQFMDQLSRANFDVMTEVSKRKIQQMKAVAGEFVIIYDEMMRNNKKKDTDDTNKTAKNHPPQVKQKAEKIKGESARDDESNPETVNSSGADPMSSDDGRKSFTSSENSRSRPRKRTTNKSRDESLIEILVEKLDNRKVADHRKFQEDKGQSLGDYLASFEKYCSRNLKGDKDTWIMELEKYLTGDALKAFEGMNDLNESYESIKMKLLTWYERRRELRKERVRDQFNQISHNNGESLYLYSTRIEKLFKRAYSKSNVDNNLILIKKFMETIPKAESTKLRAIYQYDKLKGNPLKWPEIQEWCEIRDVELEQQKCEDTDEGDKEIVINIKKNVKNQNQTSNTYSKVGYSQSNKQFYYNGGQRERNFNSKNYRNSNQTHQPHYFRPQPPPRQNFQQRQQRPQYNQFSSPYGPQYNRFPPPNQNRFPPPPQQGSKFCNHCQRLGHLENNCWMKEKICRYCGEVGHISPICPNKPKNRNQRSYSQPPSNRNHQPQQQGSNFNHNRDYNNSNGNRNHGTYGGYNNNDYNNNGYNNDNHDNNGFNNNNSHLNNAAPNSTNNRQSSVNSMAPRD